VLLTPIVAPPDGEIRGDDTGRCTNAAPPAAAVPEVEVNPSNGNVRVTRVIVGHDRGLITMPGGLNNQIGGTMIHKIGRTLPSLPHGS
jgi:CO/xanthine dehydrogenase Mo-binding subunit